MSPIEQLLRQTMGLDPASIGSSAIARAVRQRLAASGRRDVEAYADLVRVSEVERQELIEAVVVPETWFFRDREALTAAGRLARDQWLGAAAQGPLRWLSVPCATGEEPYSLAIALLESGVPGTGFHIDAVDISARALVQAREAVYGTNSFRGTAPAFRESYFRPAADGWRLEASIRRRVSFRQGNLAASSFLPGPELYDGIFCRNLLIYLDGPARESAWGALRRLLRPTGCLFVGPAEGSLLLDHGFVSAGLPQTFAFRPADAPRASRGARPPADTPWSPPPTTARPRPRGTPRRGEGPASAALPAPQPRDPAGAATPRGGDELQRASALADAGRLREAEELCQEFLRGHPPKAQAFYLLGLLRDATGAGNEASEFYRKAIYLDPGHAEALAHLAGLRQQHGDPEGARRLRQRARRSATPALPERPLRLDDVNS